MTSNKAKHVAVKLKQRQEIGICHMDEFQQAWVHIAFWKAAWYDKWQQMKFCLTVADLLFILFYFLLSVVFLQKPQHSNLNTENRLQACYEAFHMYKECSPEDFE